MIAIVAGVFAAALASGLLPTGGGTEAIVVGASALTSTVSGWAVVAAASAAQVVAKLAVRLAARGALRLPWLARARPPARVVARVDGSPWARRGAILTGAGVGLPPLYAIAVASGLLGTPAAEFALVAFVGHCARYGALWAVPSWFGF